MDSAQNGSNAGNITDEIPYEVNIMRYFFSVIFCFIVLFGVAGNILTMIVLSSKKLNTTSTSFYLFALALVDLLYCILIIQKIFDNFVFFPDNARNLSPVLCRISPVLTYFLTYFSCWLLVAVTIDRMICVVLPFQAKRFCTRKLSMAITTVIGTLSFVTVLHFFFTMNHTPTNDPNKSPCRPDKLTGYLFPYVDLILAMAGPFVIMLAANTAIILKLNELKRTRMNNLRKNSTRGEDKTQSLTTMLLSISFFFMVSSTPLLTYDIVYFTVEITSYKVFFGVEQVSYTLWYLNYSVHFLLYCLTGPRFREEAKRLFGWVRTAEGENQETTVVVRNAEYKSVMTTKL